MLNICTVCATFESTHLEQIWEKQISSDRIIIICTLKIVTVTC